MNRPVRRKPRIFWRDEETFAFLQAWKKHYHICRFIKRFGSKKPLYSAIAEDLEARGFNRTLAEIEHKMGNTKKRFKEAKMELPREKAIKEFKYFCEVDEILSMDMTGQETLSESEIRHLNQDRIITHSDESHDQGSVPENFKLMKINLPCQSGSSESEEHSNYENAVNEGIQVAIPQSTSTKKTTEDMFSKFYKEFERSNRQLEMNDAVMLELFKEQNDIFRTQTTLLMKLLTK